MEREVLGDDPDETLAGASACTARRGELEGPSCRGNDLKEAVIAWRGEVALDARRGEDPGDGDREACFPDLPLPLPVLSISGQESPVEPIEEEACGRELLPVARTWPSALRESLRELLTGLELRASAVSAERWRGFRARPPSPVCLGGDLCSCSAVNLPPLRDAAAWAKASRCEAAPGVDADIIARLRGPPTVLPARSDWVAALSRVPSSLAPPTSEMGKSWPSTPSPSLPALLLRLRLWLWLLRAPLVSAAARALSETCEDAFATSDDAGRSCHRRPDDVVRACAEVWPGGTGAPGTTTALRWRNEALPEPAGPSAASKSTGARHRPPPAGNRGASAALSPQVG
mmetsp:Transcript_69225/g.150645  ORF Transcript_69225/g.150645 Transcript_69225/m.150645 type:complete len:345 (-) Transcript_69225:174-1208(-)